MFLYQLLKVLIEFCIFVIAVSIELSVTNMEISSAYCRICVLSKLGKSN